jgi:hypothetical protein
MATKSAKATAPKTVVNKNVDRIQKTAKNVNDEMAKTANVVVENVVANSKELKALATKTAKEATKKIDLKKNVEMIRKTTESVNQQIMKTAEVVMEDLTEASKVRVETVAKQAKSAIENFDLTEQIETAKKTAKKANKIALETANEAVDGAFVNGEKWQNVAAKAVKGGLHLAGRQQAIMFDTLDAVKGQFSQSALRFKKLFGSN